MSTRYFAYGANMDPVHMAKCCPGAQLLGLAVLQEHGFRIAAKGFGNAVPAPGEAVHGVLWELEPEDEAALDGFEGIPEGLYRKSHRTVRTNAGTRVRAMLYLPVDSAPGSPVPGYLERILEVASALDFPPGYLQGLRALL